MGLPGLTPSPKLDRRPAPPLSACVGVVYTWRTGAAADYGWAAAEAARRLRDEFVTGLAGQATFDALMSNRLDLAPSQVTRLIDAGCWPGARPPSASAHGRALFGDGAPAPVRLRRAPRAAASSPTRRAATPAGPDAYRRLIESTQADRRARSRKNAVLRRLKGHRDAALFALLYTLGLRASEVVALSLADYDPAESRLTVRRNGTGASRTLPVVGSTARVLNDLARHRPAHVTTLLPSFDAAMRTVSSDPTPGMVTQTIRSRWARGSGAVGDRYPQVSDMRAALAAHLRAAPGVPASGVDWVLGRRVRRATPLTDSDHTAIRAALVAWASGV